MGQVAACLSIAYEAGAQVLQQNPTQIGPTDLTLMKTLAHSCPSALTRFWNQSKDNVGRWDEERSFDPHMKGFIMLVDVLSAHAALFSGVPELQSDYKTM